MPLLSADIPAINDLILSSSNMLIKIQKINSERNFHLFESYDDLVTNEDLCEMLGIGKNAAYELLQRKLIKSFHIGRSWKIPKKAVEEYIYQQSGIKKQTYYSIRNIKRHRKPVENATEKNLQKICKETFSDKKIKGRILPPLIFFYFHFKQSENPQTCINSDKIKAPTPQLSVCKTGTF